nr:MAG TPA: hypothetical protein [Caudoviricetes sp.]DAZ48829.1 MAG TPA: hypothetical protein [Caudoviricetes sp.]
MSLPNGRLFFMRKIIVSASCIFQSLCAMI